ncbi:MAG: response regulator transcription factor [Flavobacteriales bacterium]|nr:response regulator transcription factor [Flavobacteriales bacterium]
MNDQAPIAVCVVEDEPAIREVLEKVMETEVDILFSGAFSTGEAALKFMPALNPRVVIMDISLPGISGIECVKELRQTMPGTLFLMFTMHDDDGRVFEALKSGAHGYLLKNTPIDELLRAVRELVNGGSPMSASVARKVIAQFHRMDEAPKTMEVLTIRENEVLKLLSEGLLYKEIASRMGISANTVGQYVYGIYRKLHVNNRMEAVNKYLGR